MRLPALAGQRFSSESFVNKANKGNTAGLNQRRPSPSVSGRLANSRSRLLTRCALPAILCASVIAATLVFHQRAKHPALAVPIPPDLERLEPQLRAYVLEKVNWVRDAPRSANRHATLGMVYAVNALWPEARQAFQNAAVLDPKEPLASLYGAIATQELGQFDDALRLLRQLTTQFPRFAPGLCRLGEALLRAGNVEEAGPAFERLTALAPEEWRGFAGLGDVKLRKGDDHSAARLLERAIALDPTAKKAHHLLGLAYRGLGRLDDAQLELSLGLNGADYPMPDAWSETAPQHMKLIQDQVEIANQYSLTGQAGQAVEVIAKALTFQPTNLALLNNLAIAYNRSGQPDKARSILLQVLRTDPRNLPALVALSFSCSALDRYDEALGYADKSIALAPDTANPYVAKANVLLAMERDLDALQALQSALRCDPRNAEIQLEIGDVCWRNLQRPAQAMENYQAARRSNPALMPVYVRLADLHLQLNQPGEARAALETLRKLPHDARELAALENRLRERTTQ